MTGHDDPTGDAAGGRVRVLVPIEILRGESIPESVLDLLAHVEVVLLGYHVIPEQTAVEQAQEQFEAKARGELATWESQLVDRGGRAETRLVFTHDAEQTFERIAIETASDAILLLNPAPTVERVLVPLRGEVNVDRIASIVAAVIPTEGVEVVLFHATADQEAMGAGEALLDRAAATIAAAGVDPTELTRQVVVTDEPQAALFDAADGVDLVVMGEDRPSVSELIFGETFQRVAELSLGPVLVVRRLEEGRPGPIRAQLDRGRDRLDRGGDRST